MSKAEIEKIMNRIDINNIPYANLEQALFMANIKIALNLTLIFYIIDIPKTNETVYEKLLIKPIKTEKNIIPIIPYKIYKF